MSDFRKGIEEFRDAMYREAELAPAPPLWVMLKPVRSSQWIPIAAVLILMVGGSVTFRNVQRNRAAEQDKADELLLQKVSMSIGRSVPRALSPLLGN
jgi:hypothetical protein